MRYTERVCAKTLFRSRNLSPILFVVPMSNWAQRRIVCSFCSLSSAVIVRRYTGNLYKVVPRLRECCREVEADEVNNSRNKILQTWERPYRFPVLVLSNWCACKPSYGPITQMFVFRKWPTYCLLRDSCSVTISQLSVSAYTVRHKCCGCLTALGTGKWVWRLLTAVMTLNIHVFLPAAKPAGQWIIIRVLLLLWFSL